MIDAWPFTVLSEWAGKAFLRIWERMVGLVLGPLSVVGLWERLPD